MPSNQERALSHLHWIVAQEEIPTRLGVHFPCALQTMLSNVRCRYRPLMPIRGASAILLRHSRPLKKHGEKFNLWSMNLAQCIARIPINHDDGPPVFGQTAVPYQIPAWITGAPN
jgi:hypothetical protein